MTNPQVQRPSRGVKLRASWGAAVSDAIEAHEADLQSLRQPGKWQSLRVEDAETLAPFTVRLHKTEDDPDGLWEIYLPPGCCNVGGPCEPLNPPASDTSGHEDDDPAWRSLGRPRFSDFYYKSVSADDGNDITRRGVVEVHVKPSAKMYGVDLADAPARRVVWACVRDQLYWDYLMAHANLANSHRWFYRDTAGDIFKATVAEIFHVQHQVIDGNVVTYGDPRVSVRQLRTTPIDAALPQGTGVSGFDLVWALAFSESSGGLAQPAGSLALEVKNLLCVRQIAAVAGIAVTGNQMTDVTDAEWVYAKIHADDMSNGADIVEVVSDPGNDVYSGDTNIVWLPLYQLKHNTVTADHREASLKNVQLYRA